MIGPVGNTVLIIDDDAAFRGLARRVLEGLGLAVCAEAGTVEAAVDAALALKPDAALVDVGLPDGDGVALGRELASLPWRPRVVLTSSDRDAARRASSGDGQAIVFVPKDELPNAPLHYLFAIH
jgi:DNA-binding NarL/FixJ family response regulator